MGQEGRGAASAICRGHAAAGGRPDTGPATMAGRWQGRNHDHKNRGHSHPANLVSSVLAGTSTPSNVALPRTYGPHGNPRINLNRGFRPEAWAEPLHTV
jgi:hypothetical protein